MSSSESDSERRFRRFFGSQTRHRQKGRYEMNYASLAVPKKLKKLTLWGDSDSDDDYAPGSPALDAFVPPVPPMPPAASAPPVPPMPPLPPSASAPPVPPMPPSASAPPVAPMPSNKKSNQKDDKDAFSAKAVKAPDESDSDHEAKYDSANEAPPSPVLKQKAPLAPIAPPLAPPPPVLKQKAPLDQATKNVTAKVDEAGLLDEFRKGGAASDEVKQAVVIIINKEVNKLIGKGTFTEQEGFDAKGAIFDAIVNSTQKKHRTLIDKGIDMFQQVKNAMAKRRVAIADDPKPVAKAR